MNEKEKLINVIKKCLELIETVKRKRKERGE